MRALNLPLIKCEVSLTLTWSANHVVPNKACSEADPDADPAVAGTNSPTKAILDIIDRKLYVPVVNLLSEDDNNSLQQLETGLKRTAKWNKCRSYISDQIKKKQVKSFD